MKCNFFYVYIVTILLILTGFLLHQVLMLLNLRISSVCGNLMKVQGIRQKIRQQTEMMVHC